MTRDFWLHAGRVSPMVGVGMIATTSALDTLHRIVLMAVVLVTYIASTECAARLADRRREFAISTLASLGYGSDSKISDHFIDPS